MSNLLERSPSAGGLARLPRTHGGWALPGLPTLAHLGQGGRKSLQGALSFLAPCGRGDLGYGGRITDPAKPPGDTGVLAAAGTVGGGGIPSPVALAETPLSASIFCFKTLGKS